MVHMLNGTALAVAKQKKLSKRVAELKKKGIIPGMGILQVGVHAPSAVYIKLKERRAKEIGIEVVKKKLPETASQETILKEILKLNRNKKIHGILVQLPLPKGLDQKEILSAIDPDKDIDCLHPVTQARLFAGDTSVQPPTAQAVIELIKETSQKIKGSNCVVIGEGMFGRQIALRLLNMGATIIVAHKDTKDLVSLTKNADILVSVVGKKDLVKAEMVKRGTVVIDVGVTIKNKKAYGDIDQSSVAKKAGYLTPSPGGVGPMTVVQLLENVVKSAADSQ